MSETFQFVVVYFFNPARLALQDKSKGIPRRMTRLLRKPSPEVIDPGAPFVSTVVDDIERACRERRVEDEKKPRIAQEMRSFYELLGRMQKNCLRIREILENDDHEDGEQTDIFVKTDMADIVEDQSHTVFELFEHLLTQADLYEIFIPDFSDHLWGLLNCREGVLRSVVSGYLSSGTSVSLFLKIDKEAKKAGLPWTPYFSDLIDSEYHPELNRAYGVQERAFVRVDLSKKDSKAFAYVCAHLKDLEDALGNSRRKFADLLRENYSLGDLAGRQGESPMPTEDETRFGKLRKAALNHPWVASLLFVGAVVIALGAFSEALVKISDLFRGGRVAGPQEPSRRISVNSYGFAGMRADLQRHQIRQIFGDPLEEQRRFWRYDGFGIGFKEDSQTISNINFLFDGKVPWETEEGLRAGATWEDVIQIYGVPESGAFSASIYYYERFTIDFDEDGRIAKLIIWIPARPQDELTFTEIEDSLIAREHANPGTIPSAEFVRRLGTGKKELDFAYYHILGTRKDPVVVDRALKDLKSEDAYLWLYAAQYLGACGKKEAVPYLIKALRHSIRLWQEERVAWLQELTGQDIGNDYEQWKLWFEKNYGLPDAFDWDSGLGSSARKQ